mmetsp:Transcript_131815/g.253667  ORF Transcript_131815/g.253667 Transcript_131815/m.253667 type:complete len:235 (-) Transcript_131815:223-927(-)
MKLTMRSLLLVFACLSGKCCAFEAAVGFNPSTARPSVRHASHASERRNRFSPVMQEMPPPPPIAKFNVKSMPGVSPPLGFFDPAGFTNGASESKIRFYREVELKHCRVSMLAALGIPVAEQFHPLFGGNIDVPAVSAFQETPLQTFWGLTLFAIAIPEVLSVFTFNSPFGGELWSIRTDYEPGNLGFDPLGFRPDDADAWKEIQTKELNNGRLAMIATIGMLGQELVRGEKLFR